MQTDEVRYDVDGPVAEFFLASTLSLGGSPSVMVPVATDKTRGLILIFMETDSHGIGRLKHRRTSSIMPAWAFASVMACIGGNLRKGKRR